MLGAFCAYFLLELAGVGYWWSLLLAPIAVGIVGIVIEKTMLKRLYALDHLYGLLLTFGLALVLQGLFTNYYGSSGLPYRIPEALSGGFNLGFMFLPKYPRVGDRRLARRVRRHLVRDRAHEARVVPARGHRESDARAGLRQSTSRGWSRSRTASASASLRSPA
jgi:hypothetical protein